MRIAIALLSASLAWGQLSSIPTVTSASDLSAGTLPAARLPAHTGDVTSPAGSAVTTVAFVGGATAAAVATASTAAPVVGSVSVTGQTTALGATTFYTSTVAGTYRMCVAAWLTTTGTGGNMGIYSLADSGNGLTPAASILGNNVNMASITGNSGGCVVLRLGTAKNLQYQTVFNAVTGSPVYNLDVTVEKLK
ncbi:MAG: hypothetical protein JWN34_2025 [Bryobacterales bacterium]|nr:hypothetical protein [Bryobacterales bacterium]